MFSRHDFFVRRLHEQPIRLVLALTGGGSEAISQLFTVPGASRIMVEAIVPYSSEALVDWLGATPEKFCDERTARLMAMRAYERARLFEARRTASVLTTMVPVSCVGLACTASLASEPPKKGAHRFHIAWQTATTTATASLELIKRRRTRSEEEMLTADMILNEIAAASGLADRVPLTLFPSEGEVILSAQVDAPREWQQLLSGEITAAKFFPHGEQPSSSNEPPHPKVILPGAFRPLHDGHLQMAAVASQMLKEPVAFEISMTNVDKPPLDFKEMTRRAEQFAADQSLWFTRAPTFAEKSQIFPGATFVVGADTILRIADPKYYGGDISQRDRAIEQLASRACRFLVFGRLHAGAFQTIDDLPLPHPLRALCIPVPAEQFRLDISSTELREQEN